MDFLFSVELNGAVVTPPACPVDLEETAVFHEIKKF
jgi:hypothetical protein